MYKRATYNVPVNSLTTTCGSRRISGGTLGDRSLRGSRIHFLQVSRLNSFKIKNKFGVKKNNSRWWGRGLDAPSSLVEPILLTSNRSLVVDSIILYWNDNTGPFLSIYIDKIGLNSEGEEKAQWNCLCLLSFSGCHWTRLWMSANRLGQLRLDWFNRLSIPWTYLYFYNTSNENKVVQDCALWTCIKQDLYHNLSCDNFPGIFRLKWCVLITKASVGCV